MPRVKGTMLVDWAKTIRKDASRDYSRYLSEDDRRILAGQVLPSAWYPFETYRHLFGAVVKELAGDNMDAVYAWGREFGEKTLREIYSSLIACGAPMDVVDKYKIIFKKFFDFGEFVFEPAGENQVVLKVRDFAPEFEPFFHGLRGWIERSLELGGAKEVTSEFLAKSWQGAPETAIRFAWKG